MSDAFGGYKQSWRALFQATAIRGPVWIAVVLLFVLASAVSPAFMSLEEVRNIFQVTAFLGIAAIGQTIALMVGGIDLLYRRRCHADQHSGGQSDGRTQRRHPLAVIVTPLGWNCRRARNGALIAYLGVTPMIATLSTNSILFGIALVYTGGAPHGSAAPSSSQSGRDISAGSGERSELDPRCSSSWPMC